MNRCSNKVDLEVHHKNTNLTEETGLNDIGNAIVLCESCHDNRHSEKIKPLGNPEFHKDVREEALKNAENQCQCEEVNCHGFGVISRILSNIKTKK